MSDEERAFPHLDVIVVFVIHINVIVIHIDVFVIHINVIVINIPIVIISTDTECSHLFFLYPKSEGSMYDV